jgi:3-hydroxyacyl-CoA dehydrogenase
MSELVRYALKDGVAVVTVDNPPVNALAPAVWTQIEDAVGRGVDDPGAGRLPHQGNSTFIAGADIKAFELLKTR